MHPKLRALVTSTGKARAAWTVLAGLLLALGQAPLSVPWGIFPAFAILTLLTAESRAKPAAWTLWVAGASYFAASLTWIIEPFLVDFARHGWMAPFALVLMSGGLALFWAGAGALVALVKGLPARGLTLAVSLALMEYARANVMTGFPWGLLAYHWIDTPIAQGLSIFGPHGLGLLTGLLGVATVLARPWGLIASALITATIWVGFASTTPNSSTPENSLIVRLIQPNAAQHLKWKSENLQMFFDRQIELTKTDGPRDVVIWPETAVPYPLGARPDLDQMISAAAQAPVVLGARRMDQAEDMPIWFNSLGVIETSGTLAQSYDKHHLVPFGEYLPLASLMKRFGLTGLAQSVGGFGAGDGPSVLDTENLPPFLPLICYEAIFPNALNPPGVRPDWLLHITNDAWFGTFTGPYQHLAQARARAIEQGLPLARAANTGISAMIDPWGRLTVALPLGKAGVIDAPLPAPRSATIYAVFGDFVFFPICVFLIVTAIGLHRHAKA